MGISPFLEVTEEMDTAKRDDRQPCGRDEALHTGFFGCVCDGNLLVHLVAHAGNTTNEDVDAAEGGD